MKAFIKIEDTYPESPRVASVGPLAGMLYIAAICYTSRNHTEDFVPSSVMNTLVDFEGYRIYSVEIRTHELIRKLLRADLLRRMPGGYRLMGRGDIWQYGAVISDRPDTEEWADLRATVFERDNYTCQYCGQRGGKLECDHIVPVSRGGSHDLDNLTTACFPCNRAKGNKTPEEWSGRVSL